MDSLTGLFAGGTSPLTGGGGILSKILPLVLAGSGIMGTVGNISANRARNAVLGAEMSQMNALNRLTPAQITSGILSMKQPLSSNLTSSVGNVVQGQLAGRGLSQAPGIFASSLAQGLAPYDLQMLQLAQDAYFKKLGLPISARPSPFGPFPQQTNTSQIWQALAQRFMGTNATPPLPPGSFPNYGPAAPGLDTGLPYSVPTDYPSVNDLLNLSGGTGLTPTPAGAG